MWRPLLGFALWLPWALGCPGCNRVFGIEQPGAPLQHDDAALTACPASDCALDGGGDSGLDAALSCIEGETRCSGQFVERCSKDGVYIHAEDCPYVCRAGSCAGECVVGATRCQDRQQQRCNDLGLWAGNQLCAGSCAEGSCIACAEGTSLCSGDARLACSQGRYEFAEQCAEVCIAGECGIIPAPSCPEDLTSCDATVDGSWQAASDCITQAALTQNIPGEVLLPDASCGVSRTYAQRTVFASLQIQAQHIVSGALQFADDWRIEVPLSCIDDTGVQPTRASCMALAEAVVAGARVPLDGARCTPITAACECQLEGALQELDASALDRALQEGAACAQGDRLHIKFNASNYEQLIELQRSYLDPQRVYLKGKGSLSADRFGEHVAFSDRTAVVAAPDTEQRIGSAYVFTLEHGDWVDRGRLVGRHADLHDRFANEVAVAGDTVAVAAWRDWSGTTGVNSDAEARQQPFSGAVYLFERERERWIERHFIKASNTEQGDGFGWALALTTDLLVVGAPAEDSASRSAQQNNAAPNSGAVYVFRNVDGTWSQEAYVKPDVIGVDGNFGRSIALADDLLVVGATGEGSTGLGISGAADNDSGDGSGAVYVFRSNAGQWTQVAYLKASNTDVDDAFGTSVALHGNLLVVGAPGEDSSESGVVSTGQDNNLPDSGAVYVFTRSESGWAQTALLKASNPGENDAFGRSVDIRGPRLVVGAFQEDGPHDGSGQADTDDSAENNGCAYVFDYDGAGWQQVGYLKPATSGANSQFGADVAISSAGVLIGAPGDSSDGDIVGANPAGNARPYSGAAYILP